MINRLKNNGLYNQFKNYNDCLDRLMGIQAQIPNYAKLSILMRVKNPCLNELEDQIESDEIVRIWAQRNTLHYYNKNDIALAVAINQLIDNWFNKKWKKDINYEKEMQKVFNICTKSSYITRELLSKQGVDEKYLDSWGGLFIELTRRGLVYSPIKINSKTYYKNLGLFNPSIENYDHLLKKYVNSYKPSSYRDFNHWIGANIINKNNCPTLKKIALENSNELLIFPKYDNLLLSYHDKEWLVKKEHAKNIWCKAGHVNAVIVKNKNLICTWKYEFSKHNIEYTVYSEKQNDEIIIPALLNLGRIYNKEITVKKKHANL